VSDVLASILAREPELTALPAATPPAIRRLLGRCLRKDPAERLRDIGDARLEIADATTAIDSDAPSIQQPRKDARGRERLAWAAAVAALTLGLAGSLMRGARPSPDTSEMRVDIVTPPTAAPLAVALSPDGRTLAYVATLDGQSRLWLQSLESGSSRALTGTEGADHPFWSADSQSIGFFSDDKLRRIAVDGGSVQTLASATLGKGGTWNQNDVILFAALGNPITRVPAKGGQAVPVSRLALQGSDFSPQFLPDGQHFLYYVRGSPEVRGVYVGWLDAPEDARRLLDYSDTGAIYASSGQLLFMREGTLFAQNFDLRGLTLDGKPFPISDGVDGEYVDSGLSVSRTGTIAYRASSAPKQRQFVWFDRSGKELAKVGDAVTSSLAEPSMPRDGHRVAFYGGASGNPDIWLFDVRRGAFSAFTSDPADDVAPIWSPDGSRIIFSSNRRGVHDLYQKALAGDRSEELLLSTGQPITATDWSSDGHYVLYTSRDPKLGFDIWALPLGGKPFPVVQTAFDEQWAQFSPDGHWVAYQSNESGTSEIYVRPFPGPGEKWPVSINGGTQVRWGHDGRELFYVSRDGRLMSVPIALTSNAQAPDIGKPVALFSPPIGGEGQQGDYRHKYMVSTDSQQFLVATVKEPAPSPIRVILNWKHRS